MSKTAGCMGFINSSPTDGPSTQQTCALIASSWSNFSQTCSSRFGRSMNSTLHPCVDTSCILTLNLLCPGRLRTTSAFKPTLTAFRGNGFLGGLRPLSMCFLPQMVSVTSKAEDASYSCCPIFPSRSRMSAFPVTVCDETAPLDLMSAMVSKAVIRKLDVGMGS